MHRAGSLGAAHVESDVIHAAIAVAAQALKVNRVGARVALESGAHLQTERGDCKPNEPQEIKNEPESMMEKHLRVVERIAPNDARDGQHPKPRGSHGRHDKIDGACEKERANGRGNLETDESTYVARVSGRTRTMKRKQKYPSERAPGMAAWAARRR